MERLRIRPGAVSASAEGVVECTRRGAMAIFGMGAGIVALAPAIVLAAPAVPPTRTPITAYFLDGLVRDISGQLPAYRAPSGYRGGRRIAHMDETKLRMAGIQI